MTIVDFVTLFCWHTTEKIGKGIEIKISHWGRGVKSRVGRPLKKLF